MLEIETRERLQLLLMTRELLWERWLKEGRGLDLYQLAGPRSQGTRIIIYPNIEITKNFGSIS